MNAPQSTDRPDRTQSDEIESFLDCLYGEIEEGEEIPFWASSSKTMGFPMDEAAFRKTLRRSRVPKACYFGTSTMKRDDAGKLFNRQSQFAGFYVLVLDDIGTGLGSKIAPSALPPGLAELVTYRIETSPGNEQWGFALDHPIRILELAKAFQRVMIEASGADSGGLMPNKLVRMPCGVNLKEKYQTPGEGLFECRLLEFHSDRWNTPAALLAAVDAGVDWDELVEGSPAGSGSRKLGTTAHRKTPVYQASLSGVVDPVLEWLNETNQIVSERGEWVDIVCPWESEHSAGGGNTAGYAPIGIGSEPDRRGFHCFHDSCSSHRTGDFLAYVLEAGGPRSSPKSPIEALICRYASDMESNRMIDVISESYEAFSSTGFKMQHTTGVWVPDPSGKNRKVSEYTLYMEDPQRLRLAGCTHDPGGQMLVPSRTNGYPRLNLWRRPYWGSGASDPLAAERFVDFVHYLVPNEIDAEWFLDHLAAKAQDPKYRGPGVIMSTPVERTGRGTLEKMLLKLWGAHNVARVTLSAFLRGATGSGNNSWICREWIILPEAKETGMTVKVELTAYESLKTFIEPAGVRIMVNEKWEVSRQVECFGSTLICTQHGDVLPADAGATRFRRIDNTITPRSYAEYFVPLHEWIESPEFGAQIWPWLLERDLAGFNFRGRETPRSLEEETRAALESQRSVDAAIGLCILFAEEKMGGAVFVEDSVAVLRSIEGAIGLDSIHGWEKPVRRELRNKTRELVQINGKIWRPRSGGGAPVRIRATTQPAGIALADAVRMGRTESPFVARRGEKMALAEQFRHFCREFINPS